MRPLLIFIIPPIAGAVIGFVTNAVAIRMLFRPLKEICVFGVRLPFTPGVLPKQRYKLALSIGAMVERELLTAEVIRRRLANDDVCQKIDTLISDTTEKMYPSFADAVIQFLRKSDIRRELEAKGRIFLRNIILQLNVFQRFFLSAGQYDLTLEEKMPQIIAALISDAENLLQQEKTKKILIEAANVYANQKITGGADAQIEQILKTIDIKTLVSQRIDSLDMLRVERIILDVMADQFKWINIFGAILGFLIGSFQVLFMWIINR